MIRIGISTGDINGVGLEVILKTLSDNRVLDLCQPIIYGSSKVASYHRNIVKIENLNLFGTKSVERLKDGAINIVNCWQENVNITLGKATEEGGKYSFLALDQAMKDLNNGLIDALVTAPINKKAMQMANFPHPGHTEFITEKSGAKESLMLMVNEDLRVGLVTNHLPIRQVADAIKKEKIAQKIQIFNETLKIDFGLDRPRIAVLGLNPHAGDEGVLGEEDEKEIRPAVIEAKKKGILAVGPYPADGFFGSGEHRKFDGILAMYHDQGLVAFKALSFGEGTNYTAGLPVIRTSPDHGTAYNIVGQNIADPSSFRKALYLAIDAVRHRANYTEMHANPLVKAKSNKEEIEE